MNKQKFASLIANARPSNVSTRHMMIVSIVAMGVTSTVAIVGLATTSRKTIICDCSSDCCI